MADVSDAQCPCLISSNGKNKALVKLRCRIIPGMGLQKCIRFSGFHEHFPKKHGKRRGSGETAFANSGVLQAEPVRKNVRSVVAADAAG